MEGATKDNSYVSPGHSSTLESIILPSSATPAYLAQTATVAEQLKSDLERGLTAEQVRSRHERYGLNRIQPHKPRSAWLIFAGRFKDPLVLFLTAAGLLSLLLGYYADAIIIAIAVIVDASLNYVQIWRTERILERLAQHVQSITTVIRGGQIQNVQAYELAVGDIIELNAGEKVPADARIITCKGLRVYEASLTGESDDAKKSSITLKSRTPLGNRTNMVFMGTTIMSGTARAIVTATGTHTEFGKIAQLLKGEQSPESPLRRKLKQLSIFIAWILVGMVIIITAIDLTFGDSLINAGRTALMLIVSAIPEDLTVVLTIALSVGVIRLLKQKGAVRDLSSAESLGAATVICTDKTGTLTQGEMQADALHFLQGSMISSGQQPQDQMQSLALIGLALASNAHHTEAQDTKYIGSATERSALAFVERFGLLQTTLQKEWRMRDAITFDSRWKYRATLHDHPIHNTQTLFVSGAPEVLLEHSAYSLDQHNKPHQLTSSRRAELTKEIHRLATSGKRLLAVAIRPNMHQDNFTHHDIHSLVFLGVLTITDPIRPEIKTALLEAKTAGVAVKIVTGDYEATAKILARSVGLIVPDEAVLTGAAIEDMSDQELAQVVNNTIIFARVSPLDKQRIVRALQNCGHVVAMTGDGVNDAVALKSADIGVAMGTGKDIAKDAADLILLNDSFATIVTAIREGRIIRDNIRKVIAFLLSTNFAEVAIFLASLLLHLPLPLLPLQILWINLVTDGTADIALAMEPAEKNVMHRSPEHPDAPLISKALALHIGIVGIITTASVVGLYWYVWHYVSSDMLYVRTIIFAFLSLTSILSTWSYRSLHERLISRGLWQNPWVILSAGISFALLLVAIYTPGLQSFFQTVPLSPSDWLVLFLLAIPFVIIVDLRKIVIPEKRARAKHSYNA